MKRPGMNNQLILWRRHLDLTIGEAASRLGLDPIVYQQFERAEWGRPPRWLGLACHAILHGLKPIDEYEPIQEGDDDSSQRN